MLSSYGLGIQNSNHSDWIREPTELNAEVMLCRAVIVEFLLGTKLVLEKCLRR